MLPGPVWSSIPTELLVSELSKRVAEFSKRDDVKSRPECGSGELGAYNMGLHVFALFLVLVLSTTFCAIPIMSRGSDGSSRSGVGIRKEILFHCQHFGTGVLLATAFVHLLPTAFTSLTDPCLPHLYSEGYRPLAGLIAMVSALVFVAIESYLHLRGAGHSHESGDGLPTDSTELRENEASQSLIANAAPISQSTPNQTSSGAPGSISGEEEPDHDVEGARLMSGNVGDPSQEPNQRPFKADSRSGQGPDVIAPKSEEEKKKLEVQCLLLEAGILFHSVFIGMSLSVATGPSFVLFLGAIALHQCFEGVALGSRIAAIQHPNSAWKPWLMVLAFGLTTPIGQAIGLIVREFYDPMSQTGLLMVGFTNAISSGLLLFAGLHQLLAEDFLSDKSYTTLRGGRRVRAFASVFGGAALMALVGAFA
ncbi:Zinc/iron permease [Rhypophila decipiens]|uniref:Zinc/iron permease n=1 Tax=Rhypophila decipiens TaxID=261697 RepID=A0AAN7B751_9PEZI|nr:Zinc/iron permease [Rhypophila decipiens]